MDIVITVSLVTFFFVNVTIFLFFFQDDEIRQNEGFKNVSLGNVIPAAYKDAVLPFLNGTDKQLLNKHRVTSFEVRFQYFCLSIVYHI